MLAKSNKNFRQCAFVGNKLVKTFALKKATKKWLITKIKLVKSWLMKMNIKNGKQ